MQQRLAWPILLANTLFIQALTAILRPTTAYRALELDVSATWLGLLSASFAGIPLLAGWSIGRTTDRSGAGLVISAGAAICCSSAAGLVFLSPSVGWLALWSAGLGLGQLMNAVASQSLVADVRGPDQRDRAFAHYTLATAGGQLVGPLIVAALGGSSLHPGPMNMLPGIAPLCGLLLVASLSLRAPSRMSARRRTGTPQVRTLLRVPGMRSAILASTVVLSAVDLLTVYLPALGSEQGLSGRMVGLLLAFRAGASIASRFFLMSMIGRFGRRTTLWGSMVVAAIGVAAIPLASSAPMMLIIAVTAAGLGLGVGQPLTMAWVAGVAPYGSRSTALALRLMGNRFGQVTVPSAVGLLAGFSGVAAVFWAMASIVSLTALGTARSPEGSVDT